MVGQALGFAACIDWHCDVIKDVISFQLSVPSIAGESM